MIDPKNVRSPKSRLSGPVRVLYIPKDRSYSIATFIWDDHPAVGIRWNGDPDNDRDIGNPQSRGLPTWFILPEPIADILIEQLELDVRSPGLSRQEETSINITSQDGLEAQIELVAERVVRRLLEQREEN